MTLDQRSQTIAEFLLYARSRAVDQVTAEVVEALDGAGVASILLKGPSIEHWLYEDGERWYVDSDVLVAADEFGAAQRILADLGFEKFFFYVDRPDNWTFHDEMWVRPKGMVDLHRTLAGLGADPSDVWEALDGGTTEMEVAGRKVRVLDRVGTAMHIALHAAAHGRAEEQPLEDLSRGLERFPADVWHAAARLADRLDGTAAFAAGLRLHPAGAELAEDLSLPRQVSPAVALALTTPPRGAKALQRWSSLPGARAKTIAVARWIVPSRSYMRASSRRAREGTAGLIAAYGERLLTLSRLFPPAFRAWRKTVKRKDGPPAP